MHVRDIRSVYRGYPNDIDNFIIITHESCLINSVNALRFMLFLNDSLKMITLGLCLFILKGLGMRLFIKK